MTILCLISGLISLAVWLAAGAGAAHLLKAGLSKLSEQLRDFRRPGPPQIYLIAPAALPAPTVAPWPEQFNGWPPPTEEDRYASNYVRYGQEQPRAIDSPRTVFDVVVPSDLATYQAASYLDQALGAAGPNVSQMRLRRGRCTAMDALAQAARARGLRVRWVAAPRFEDAGWVIEHG